MSKRINQFLEWAARDHHTVEGWLAMLFLGIPFGVVCGAIAGLCSSDLSLAARTWQVIGRVAAIAFVALCIALMARAVQSSPGYWSALAVAGVLLLVAGNAAEYRGHQRAPAEPPDAMDSRRRPG
jgi:peptidoglycan/LPS O-acetylase OafA/YrhL